MDTPKLTGPDIRHAIALAGALVTGLTAVGFLLGSLAPSLAGNTAPHPALSGSVADAASILMTNLRVLAVPFLFSWIGLGRSRAGQLIGDVVLVGLAAVSTVVVGVQLGRWRGQLIPYIPQLPIEWAALAVALSGWLLVRNNRQAHRQLPALAATAVALVVIAAGVETWCTPHRSRVRTATRPIVEKPVRWTFGGSVVLSATDFAPPPASFKVTALPFPHRVRFRTASSGGTVRAHKNHQPHRRRSTQMNSVNLIGRLTADPELKTTKSDTAVAGLRLAIQRPRRGGEDQGADYVDITAFGTQAETAAQYLTKGRKVAVTGRLRHSEWDSDSGRRQKLEVIADQIEFLDPKATAGEEAEPVANAA